MKWNTKDRIEALAKAGFKVAKYRELKSGMQYKVLTPKAIRRLCPVIYVRDSLEEAVAHAEGMVEAWNAAKRAVARHVVGLGEAFGEG